MFNITIDIKADALANAITALANALASKNQSTEKVVEIVSAPVTEKEREEIIKVAAEVFQPPVQAPAVNPVPVATAPTYSKEQLAVAATQINDAGRKDELISLLASFGVPSLVDLPVDQYGAFATALRGMGAQI